MATTGQRPNAGFALVDGLWLRALADGQNQSFVGGLTAHAGGGKASALQIANFMALVQLSTVATNGDSALLPAAKAGAVVLVSNAGAATLSLYGAGADTINGAATANNFDLATNVSALFFCAVDGQWKAIKSA